MSAGMLAVALQGLLSHSHHLQTALTLTPPYHWTTLASHVTSHAILTRELQELLARAETFRASRIPGVEAVRARVERELVTMEFVGLVVEWHVGNRGRGTAQELAVWVRATIVERGFEGEAGGVLVPVIAWADVGDEDEMEVDG